MSRQLSLLEEEEGCLWDNATSAAVPWDYLLIFQRSVRQGHMI